jgi:hypothetical protein
VDDLEQKTDRELVRILWDEIARVEGSRIAKAVDPRFTDARGIVKDRITVRADGSIAWGDVEVLSRRLLIEQIRQYRAMPSKSE